MVNINLLPWRTTLSKYQKRALQKNLFRWALLAMVLLWSMHWVITSKHQKILAQITHLKQKMDDYQTALTVQQAKHQVMNQMHNIIHYAEETEKLLRSLSNHYPALCFNEMIRDKNSLLVRGETYSSTDLTAFLQHWQAADLFAEIRIKSIERSENNLLQFNFQALTDNASSENQENSA